MKKFNFTVSIMALLTILLTVFTSAAAPEMYTSTDFGDVTIADSGDTTVGKVKMQGFTGGKFKIINSNGNKYLQMSRTTQTEKSEVIMEFDNGTNLASQYVFQYDAKLDGEFTNADVIYLLYGRKATSAGTKWEFFLNLNPEGKIYTSKTASDSTIIGTLSKDKFTNIAVAINDETKTFSVYLDGVIAAKDISFATAGYEGLPSTVATKLRIGLQSATFEAGIDIDNLKIYSGNEIISESTTTAPGTTSSNTTAPKTFDNAVFFAACIVTTASVLIIFYKTAKKRISCR